MSFDETGWWTKTEYWALVMNHIYASHSEVYAIFSNKEAAEARAAEFEAKTKKSAWWTVHQIDMKRGLGFLGHGRKFEEIVVVNTVPSVAEFAFYPNSMEMNKFKIDDCPPLE